MIFVELDPSENTSVYGGFPVVLRQIQAFKSLKIVRAFMNVVFLSSSTQN